jgi:hypothetical protein
MCNRDSFVLYPTNLGIGVAFGASYHHTEIQVNLFGNIIDGMKKGLTLWSELPCISIECIAGDVNSWRWDNVPQKYQTKRTPSAVYVTGIDPASRPSILATNISVACEMVPDLPGWLEPRLPLYKERVHKILQKLNIVRDKLEYVGGAEEFFRRSKMRTEFTAYPQYPSFIDSMDWAGGLAFRLNESRTIDPMFTTLMMDYIQIPGFVTHPIVYEYVQSATGILARDLPRYEIDPKMLEASDLVAYNKR